MAGALETQMAAKTATKKITPKVSRTKVTKVKVVKKVTPKKKVTKVTVKKVVKTAPKPAPRPVKAYRPKRVSAGKKKGWFGDLGGTGDLSQWYGPKRKLFLPPGLFERSDVSSYLNGTLAGDYGYDPLSLGKNAAQVEKYREYELIHARWAMLGAAGILIPEGLAANGADLKGPVWYETGLEMLTGDGTLNYFAVPWVVLNNPLPLIAIFGIEVLLMGAAERYRQSGEGPPGYAPRIGDFDSSAFRGLDKLYPGGPLDPFGLADDPKVFEELKVKEIKNGRLAMVATLGFAVQAAVTGEGPYANWSKHVADPFGYNLLTILGSEDRTPTL